VRAVWLNKSLTDNSKVKLPRLGQRLTWIEHKFIKRYLLLLSLVQSNSCCSYSCRWFSSL